MGLERGLRPSLVTQGCVGSLRAGAKPPAPAQSREGSAEILALHEFPRVVPKPRSGDCLMSMAELRAVSSSAGVCGEGKDGAPCLLQKIRMASVLCDLTGQTCTWGKATLNHGEVLILKVLQGQGSN